MAMHQGGTSGKQEKRPKNEYLVGISTHHYGLKNKDDKSIVYYPQTDLKIWLVSQSYI